MSQRLPPVAYGLGLAGLLPFIGCGILAVSQVPQQAIGLPALVAYGAVILSFLGAVHWGLALAPGPVLPTMPPVPHPSVRGRLALGVVPSLLGWAAMLLALAGWPDLGLLLLTAGFIATIVVEARWGRAGLLPSGYITLRWVLSIIVVVTLVTVLALRLLGATIVF